ncbi:MAG TPA: 3'-5' exonuclease [Chitinophagaceae bacterium]|nr:3'-5' exonuclease [Chitinophagales bacterium]HPG10070.1 3'-5' exonuclease [Chitinophagaceae bacterium]
MSSLPVNNVLFLDIETVPQYSDYQQMPESWKKLWDLKAQYLVRNKEDETTESIYPRAGIYAEFGRIICISCGYITGSAADKKITLKSFAGDDEKKILFEFAEMIKKWSADSPKYLCAHNGKEFDFPYLCRRMIINGVAIPTLLNMSGKKPWEVNHLDTMELWKFGDFKSYTSLNLLAHSLGIPTPKDDIDGSMVWEVYWKEKNLDRIITYCQKDVVTVAQIFLRMNGEQLIVPENIDIK